MAKLPGFYVAKDNRTGQDFLIFKWEKELLDENFDIRPCDYREFVTLNREHRYLGILGR